jgi:hypothetical protein
MAAPHWYQPVPRGLEAKIGEKMAFLQKLDEEAGSNGWSHEKLALPPSITE